MFLAHLNIHTLRRLQESELYLVAELQTNIIKVRPANPKSYQNVWQINLLIQSNPTAEAF